MPKIDAILSYHANPATCGVTKFNMQLAERLGVPHDQLSNLTAYRYPLVSIKPEECDARLWAIFPFPFPLGGQFDLLLHGWDQHSELLSRVAVNVYRAEVLGCPSTLRGNSTRPGLNILSFGMAHKCQQPQFEQLKAILDAHGQDYTVCVSAAIHEGHPWDEATAEHERLMRAIFKDHLRFLGFLADDALAREIRDAHLVALFYDPAVRANNTTLWAALDAGTPVITNLDAQSPPELVHNRSVFDLAHLTRWPDAADCRVVRYGGHEAAKVYSWERVISKLHKSVHA